MKKKKSDYNFLLPGSQVFSRDLLIFFDTIILDEDEGGIKLSWIVLGKQVKIIGWSGHTPFHMQEKTQTSKIVYVILYHLVLCDVVFLSMITLLCLFDVSTVSEHCPFTSVCMI